MSVHDYEKNMTRDIILVGPIYQSFKHQENQNVIYELGKSCTNCVCGHILRHYIR